MEHLTSETILLIHDEISPTAVGEFKMPALRKVVEAVLKVNESGDAVYPELFTRAHAYVAHTLEEQPFIRYNDIIGWYAAKTFLRLNGVSLEATADEISEYLTKVTDRTWGEDEGVDFLYGHATFIEPEQRGAKPLWV